MTHLIAKWTVLPALLIAAMPSRFTANYELAIDAAICLGASACVYRALRHKEYIWAAALVAAAVIVSPVPLAVKILFVMGFTYVAALETLLAAFQPHPHALPATH